MRVRYGSMTVAIMSVLVAAMTAFAAAIAADTPAAKPTIAHLVVSSSTLAHGFQEPNLLNAFGCTGSNVSPPLSWSGAPKGTQSFVVTLYDPDDRDNPSGWWHWVVYDVPGNASTLPSGAGQANSAQLPAGALQGRSDLGTLAYHGPCPDKGDAPHRYTFTVYALDVAQLPVEAGASGAMVVETAHDHVLAKGALVVRHGR